LTDTGADGAKGRGQKNRTGAYLKVKGGDSCHHRGVVSAAKS